MLKKHNIHFFDAHLIPALMDKNSILEIFFSRVIRYVWNNNEYYLIKIMKINYDSENACGFSDVMFKDIMWQRYLVAKK